MTLHRPWSGTDDGLVLELTPECAGWSWTGLTVIAVPALVYVLGAYGFFALPYTIIVYPFVFLVMPVLWKRARDAGYVTAGDVVHGQYGSRALDLTGVKWKPRYCARAAERAENCTAFCRRGAKVLRRFSDDGPSTEYR